MVIRNYLERITKGFASALSGLVLLASAPGFSNDTQAQNSGYSTEKRSMEKLIELGSAEFESNAKVPAIAGGDVYLDIIISVKTSKSSIDKINEGLMSRRFQKPYGDNKELMNLVLDSNPGFFEVKFLKVNKESRIYYFFEDKLKKIREDKDIPKELRGRANSLTEQIKKDLYKTIKPNNYKGSRIVFERGLPGNENGANIRFFSSEKEGSKLVDNVELKANELPIYGPVKKILTEDDDNEKPDDNKPNKEKAKTKQPEIKKTEVKQKGSFDDIIENAQKAGILKKPED